MRTAIKLFLALSFVSLIQCETTKTADSTSPVPFKAADFPNIDSTIYGRWLASHARFANGIAYYGSLYINRLGQVGVAMTCQSGKRSATAWVQVNGRVQGATLQILNAGQSTVPGPTASGCDVSVAAASWSYQVNGDTLYLNYGDEAQISYDRQN